MHRNVSIQTPALRTIGNIVTGNEQQTQAVIDRNALAALLEMLSSPRKSIRKEACWTISNITAGTKSQIQAVLDAGFVPILLELLRTENFEIRKEAAWAISNASYGGSPEQVGTVPSLSSLTCSVSAETGEREPVKTHTLRATRMTRL